MRTYVVCDTGSPFTKHRRVLVSVYTVAAETVDWRVGGVVYCKHLHAAKPVTIIALDVVIVAPLSLLHGNEGVAFTHNMAL